VLGAVASLSRQHWRCFRRWDPQSALWTESLRDAIDDTVDVLCALESLFAICTDCCRFCFSLDVAFFRQTKKCISVV
jgi:hypothetical protein